MRVAGARLPICLGALAVDLTLWGGDTRTHSDTELPLWTVVVSAVALFTVLAVVRERHRLLFWAALAYSVVWSLALPQYQPFTAVFVALYDLARHLPTRAAAPFLLATALPWGIHTANTAILTGMDASEAAVTAALWGVMTVLVWMAGRFGYRAEENARLREEAVANRAQLARQEDRLALSRELHDVLSHSMGAISLQAAGARAIASAGGQPLDPRVAAALEAIATTSTDAMRELRRLLGFLRDQPGGDSPARAGPAVAASARLSEIDALIERTRACGVTVTAETSGKPFAMLAEQEHAAYRVVQEGLANVLRHGGRGARAALTLTWTDSGFSIDLVSSPGSGRDASTAEHGSGLGVGGLAARVASLGGELSAGPDGDTYVLYARLPREA